MSRDDQCDFRTTRTFGDSPELVMTESTNKFCGVAELVEPFVILIGYQVLQMLNWTELAS